MKGMPLQEVIPLIANQMLAGRKEIGFCSENPLPVDFLGMVISHSPRLLMCIRSVGESRCFRTGDGFEYHMNVEYTGVIPGAVTLAEDEIDLRFTLLQAVKLHWHEIYIVCRNEACEAFLACAKGFLQDGEFLNNSLQALAYTTRTVGDCFYTGLCFQLDYSISLQEQVRRDAEIEAAAAEIIAYARQAGREDWEKALAVVALFVEHCAYGTVPEAPDAAYTAYGVLVHRRAVCMGFALAICIIFRALGIPCRYVHGRYKGEPHAWNLVFLKGGWFYIDVTAAVCSGDPLRQWGMTMLQDRTVEGRQPEQLVCNCPADWIGMHGIRNLFFGCRRAEMTEKEQNKDRSEIWRCIYV